MNEKQLQSLLTNKIGIKVDKDIKRSIFYELKLSKNKAKTVPFSKFQPQQLPGLYQIKHSYLSWKLSDLDIRRVFGDGFVAYKEDSYVAVCYYEPRKPKIVYFIDIDLIYELRKTNRSIKEEFAKTKSAFNVSV